jgi:uncharacterized caspase-like protein
MARAVSINLGVNRPAGRHGGRPLQYSEPLAWRMAGLAEQAGFDSLLVLRGEAATRAALHDALTGAAKALDAGDVLLVTFSGHGTQSPDTDGDERNGWDEGWCLADGVMVDDRLAGYWQLFEAGVRIVVVADSCHSGGCARDDERPPCAARSYTPPVVPCTPAEARGIRASLLLLSSSGEDQPTREGLFGRHLLDVWDDGAFRGSYCDLYGRVRERVMMEHPGQHPQILLLGAGSPDDALETAFHQRLRTARSAVVYR